ncbi:Crp/Fnr family transcriptional regulator [Fulvivirgaceae bacterium BMA10]|uniref:Crp/Fnr family transcriptional regulator n=1 Tax=Splendidivirga corallicola TaxID=3051826 RepID=A0ABT8KR83_9BACT|nr:Crp/Fnr family transcriptional regulator [Fulvivirgaceae bacterium BMA10]
MILDEEKHKDLFQKSLNRFAAVTEDSFAKLISISKFKTVKKGEYILIKGQTARKIYFVCKGILISQWIDHEGNVHIKNFFLEGNFAASTVSLLLSAPSSFGIGSLEEGVVLEMDFTKYKQLIYECDDLKNFYIGYLEQKWIIENEKRQISFAAQNATDRYLTFLNDYPSLDRRVSQRLIASYLGITPTQLSRIRTELKKN